MLKNYFVVFFISVIGFTAFANDYFKALELYNKKMIEQAIIHFKKVAEDENHENEKLREVSVLLVYQQYETIGKSVQKHLDSFATLFNSGLQDSSVAVRLMTLKACGAIINYLAADNVVIKFQHLIPLMLKVIEECVSSGSYDIAVQELNEKRIPFIIKRPYGNSFEYWKLNDLL